MGKKSFISVVDKYFKRFQTKKIQVDLLPSNDLKIIIVIPVYNEENISATLDSLFINQDNLSFSVEVITLINNSEDAKPEIKDQNLATFKELKKLSKTYQIINITLIPVYINNLDQKHAGVGWARKLGMDLALQRFRKINYDGVIVGLDADTTVESNYLNSIYHFFKKTNFNSASIHFEHPIQGNDFDDLHYQQIINYELHLRYYKNSLEFANLPYSYHTIGSAFAVNASSYAKQGGMNRRKAGEDFYFITKLIKGENFGEITKTKVIPSPRISKRVPFGTGRSIYEGINNQKNLLLTYDFKTFELIKNWIELIENKVFKYEFFPVLLRSFMPKDKWIKNHLMILNNTNSDIKYMKLFFSVFDSFWMLKLIHFLRDNHHSNSGLFLNTNALLLKLGYPPIKSTIEQLIFFRNLDKKKGPKPLKYR